jgi:hypothetical protein
MICRTYDVPGATTSQYDQVNQKTGDKPKGVHAHIALTTDTGLRIIEVWDSTEAIDRYMQSELGAAMEEAGIPEPQVSDFEVHNLDWMG